jgi:hypothetical protein
LVEIYGAITYYLERQQDLDGYFHEVDELVARDKAAFEAAHAVFYDDMRARLARVRPRVRAELEASHHHEWRDRCTYLPIEAQFKRPP